MLNSARMRLISIELTRLRANQVEKTSGTAPTVCTNRADTKASATLMPGPAAATQTISRLGLRNRKKFTGTGLAQPNRNGARISSSSPGSSRVPNGSTWRIGLKVTRPARSAVSSPSLEATKPCAASWNVMAMIPGISQIEIL